MAVDNIAPELNLISIPEVIDVHNNPSLFEMTIGATDFGAGIHYVQMLIDRPVVTSTGPTVRLDFQPTIDDFSDGSSTEKWTFTSDTAPGDYNISWIYLADKAGNNKIYYHSDLEAMGLRSSFSISNLGEIYGTTKGDILKGYNTPDIIDGRSGADAMYGGIGDDTYIVDNKGDKAFEGNKQGLDHVVSSVSYSLGGQYIENLTLVGSAVVATGNSLANTLTGSDAANKINGGGGNDILIGGLGRDILNGGSGVDIFVFRSIEDSKVGISVRDALLDYDIGIDRIDLSGIQAVSSAAENQAFSFLGSHAFTKHAGELHTKVSSGSTVIEGDVDGDGKADFQLVLKGVVEALHASDFVL
ncbi:calcium-binding protein [Methylobacterium bullatum]|uniref:Metallopeptidase AprA n=1 Tax=Methylobacterium bullatum TaxID=570505 RepID=A0A679JQ45_9HYPH|nr:Metallopeptidase AprA [Methylobacterium bullatum]